MDPREVSFSEVRWAGYLLTFPQLPRIAGYRLIDGSVQSRDNSTVKEVKRTDDSLHRFGLEMFTGLGRYNTSNCK